MAGISEGLSSSMAHHPGTDGRAESGESINLALQGGSEVRCRDGKLSKTMAELEATGADSR